MENVVKFPSQAVRSRTEIERGIREVIRNAGASDRVADDVVRNMDEFLHILQAEFPLPVPPSAERDPDLERRINEFSTALHEYSNRLLLERVRVELARCI